MLGKDLYRIENNISLASDEIKSLVLFYRPLIGSHALSTYLNFLYTEESFGSKELNKLLNILNISVDKFEEILKKLNEYRLVTTLKKENEEKYIFILKKPLNTYDFVTDDYFSRDFIKRVGIETYQDIISSLKEKSKHPGYKDISYKYTANILDDWSNEDETLIKIKDNKEYRIDSFFDINKFLKGVSLHLFPMKYRTYENLKSIATLADLYNISFEKMKSFLPNVALANGDNFDLSLLKKLCVKNTFAYSVVADNEYKVPCILFLMNKQNGKEVSQYDRKIIYELSYDYHLKPEVINVLLEHSLKTSDNRLIEKYIISIASDMHRNNIDSYEKALSWLSYKTNKPTKVQKDIIYDDSLNDKVDTSKLKEYRK